MDFLDRFRGTPAGALQPLTAKQSDRATPLGLQVLFPKAPGFTAEQLTTALREYAPAMAEARAELVAAKELAESPFGPPKPGMPVEDRFGLLSWGRHVIQLIGCDAPMPYGPVETCLPSAMMDPALKQAAVEHQAHVLLYYAGQETDPVEQYVALSVAAGSMVHFQAMVVLNELARAAAPASDLYPDDHETDPFEVLRQLPIPYLWGGFVKMDVGDPDRPWVRTFNNYNLGLPDFSRLLSSHNETAHAFRLFASFLGYLRQSGEQFRPGEVAETTENQLFGFRTPTEEEWFLESPGEMLVITDAVEE